MAPSKKGSSRKKGKGAGVPDTTASSAPSSNALVVGAAAVVVVGILLMVALKHPTTVESGDSGTLHTAPHCQLTTHGALAVLLLARMQNTTTLPLQYLSYSCSYSRSFVQTVPACVANVRNR